MSIYKKRMKKICCCFSSAVLASGAVIPYVGMVQAEESDQEDGKKLTYEGVTQLRSQDWYLDQDISEADLEVEEVLVESGTQVTAGDPLLKLTQESYEEALSYYTAAVLKAENELTDMRLSYDQGILDTQYTYEQAKMKAEQADLVKEYQQNELTNTIEDHETVLEEMEERISELESGIASGSYGSAGSSGQAAGGGTSGGGGNASAFKDTKEEQSEINSESETDSEGEATPPGEANPESETGSEGETTPPGETNPESETDSEDEATPPGETNPESETDSEGEVTPPGETNPESETNPQEEITKLLGQIQEKKKAYEEILTQIEALLNSGSLENGAETENDTSETPQQESGTASGSHNGGLEKLQAQLQSSIDGNTNIKTNLENVQKNLSSVPDAVLNVVKAAYPDYQDYVDLLGSCIVQLNSDIEQQTSVKELIGTLENQMLVGGAEGENDRTEQEAESQPIDTSSVLSLLAKLSQTETEKSTLYDRLITIQSEQILTLEEMVDQQGGTQTEESESTQSESQTESDGSIQGELQTESDGSAQSNPQPENEGGQQSGSQNEGENQQPESSDGLQNGMLPRGQDGASSLADGSAASGFGMPSSGASAGITGGSFGGAMSGSGGTASGLETSELLSGYGNTGANELSDDEISLFGSTYDLSQVKELLEREPSDSDTAQELLEQLYDQKETVTSQYEELLRNQKAAELKIQYTYDTTVLAGELAAFTWEQEIQEWDEQLAQAKSEKAELEEIKEWLSSMEEGIVTADRDGLISSVSCETGDVLAQDTPVLGYYNTDTVTITFTVPQEEINQVQVGDTVSVDVGGWQTDAEIRERAADPVSGTSRTTVEYEVTVSLENEEGFYSAGTSATVTVDAEGKADSGNNTEQVKENE